VLLKALPTANCFEQLSTLQDTLVQDATLKTQRIANIPDIPTCDHQTKLQLEASLTQKDKTKQYKKMLGTWWNRKQYHCRSAPDSPMLLHYPHGAPKEYD
jgi:hypothetical protein